MSDIDPEEVRRALANLDRRYWSHNDPEFLVIVAVLRAWLASLPPDTTTPAPDVQAQVDAAVARERGAQQVDAAAFRLLRDEADAADAWHAETGMKVARPPRMSPATVKHIRDAEIRARSGAKGE